LAVRPRLRTSAEPKAWISVTPRRIERFEQKQARSLPPLPPGVLRRPKDIQNVISLMSAKILKGVHTSGKHRFSSSDSTSEVVLPLPTMTPLPLPFLTHTSQPSERRRRFCTATRGRKYPACFVTLEDPPANINPLLVSCLHHHVPASAGRSVARKIKVI
jgi:hypothetical protein